MDSIMQNKEKNLIIVAGQQGVGKSTIAKALFEQSNNAAHVDCTGICDVNPWEYDAAFLKLLTKNVAALTRNFWDAGYQNVVIESPFDFYEEYVEFRQLLPTNINIFMVHLCASKKVRDVRRINRSEPSSKEDRDRVDRYCPEDKKLQIAEGDYRYIKVQNENLTVKEALERIKNAIPEIYRVGSHSPKAK
jgi:guanylate kinase